MSKKEEEFDKEDVTLLMSPLERIKDNHE